MHLRRAALFIAMLALATTLSAQNLPQGVTKGPSMAGITEYAYPNGLKVLLLPDTGSSVVTINIVYLVGSRYEGYGESGMAHLLEHMNFIKSTHDRNIKKELEDHGARWNGTTDYDRTNYFETVNASDENLRWALGLEAERMVNMRMEKALLDTEMTVVRNEFERGENSVQNVLAERVVAACRPRPRPRPRPRLLLRALGSGNAVGSTGSSAAVVADDSESSCTDPTDSATA